MPKLCSKQIGGYSNLPLLPASFSVDRSKSNNNVHKSPNQYPHNKNVVGLPKSTNSTLVQKGGSRRRRHGRRSRKFKRNSNRNRYKKRVKTRRHNKRRRRTQSKHRRRSQRRHNKHRRNRRSRHNKHSQRRRSGHSRHSQRTLRGGGSLVESIPGGTDFRDFVYGTGNKMKSLWDTWNGSGPSNSPPPYTVQPTIKSKHRPEVIPTSNFVQDGSNFAIKPSFRAY